MPVIDIDAYAQAGIEVANPAGPRGGIGCALLDFDGTLSLIRGGWQDIMTACFVETLAQTPQAEAKEALATLVREFTTRLNGKPTIHQCHQLVEEVRKRGGEPRTAEEYKTVYLEQLGQVTGRRIAALTADAAAADRLLVPGSRGLLEALAAEGIELTLASGTEIEDVRREAKLLGIDRFFGPRIFGATADGPEFYKRDVIAGMVRPRGGAGSCLVAFGDGVVEIADTKEAGGLAIGVASNEARRGEVDPWKRERLLAAGADAIIADFQPLEAILAYLRGARRP